MNIGCRIPLKLMHICDGQMDSSPEREKDEVETDLTIMHTTTLTLSLLKGERVPTPSLACLVASRRLYPLQYL
jgi:hypothetical protein